MSRSGGNGPPSTITLVLGVHYDVGAVGCLQLDAIELRVCVVLESTTDELLILLLLVLLIVLHVWNTTDKDEVVNRW